ncbi:uncharacterized protein C8orf48 homolog [Lagopus muta]|uniref:uncharacterized protein C8orf48 homolog n=1 Tax=Lagopus muta TaxID=64668 RepID=UPI00209F15FC|nr:uncharacterized protein C8orf48 homolog [Lagopus muta]XP_048815168.1 uncharacterized protein C8orf48 homolog [Lagopus muta]XP_048815169.1 uncharacterized protein C8orf48 homolog [Lagopus muta]
MPLGPGLGPCWAGDGGGREAELFLRLFFTMTTTSSDGSGDYEKQQKELSQSYASSVLDYSEDTWEPFSEEEIASCQHESKSSELYCSTEDTEHSGVLDPGESMLWLAGQSHTEEQSEVVDSAAAERDFIGKLIDVLKNKEAGIKQDKFVIKTHAEVTELSEEELDALQSFCIIKIRRVLQELISEQASGGKSRKQQRGFTSKASEASDLNCIVPHQLMNRIRLKNIRETIKQVTEAQVHKSSLCPDCKKKKAELAKITFLRQKKILMERALLREKLEEQIYSRDVLTLIGETLRSFPKLSEDPRNLWQKLKGKAEGMTAFCEHLESSASLKE